MGWGSVIAALALSAPLQLLTVPLEYVRKSHLIGTVPALKDLDNAERKMNKARLALLDEIDGPLRDNQKHTRAYACVLAAVEIGH